MKLIAFSAQPQTGNVAVTIKDALPQDVDTLVRLVTPLVAEQMASTKSMSNAMIHAEKLTRDGLKVFGSGASISRFLLAYKHKTPVGTVSVTPLVDNKAEINSLIVQAEHRSQGVGSTLLQHAEILAKSIGAKTVQLMAKAHRRSFYRDRGYQLVNPLTSLTRQGIWRWLQYHGIGAHYMFEKTL